MKESPGVRERLQRQYGLKVLKLSMDNSGGANHAIFSVSFADGEEAAMLTASMQDIGLPDTPEFDSQGEAGLQDSSFRIPAHVLAALKNLLLESEPANAPLWLRLSAPLGFLAAVPWERLLQPHLGVPVLRLPYHLICPQPPSSEIDSVICFSSPASTPEHRELVDQLIEHVPIDLAKATTLHLFAGSSAYKELIEIKNQYDGQFRINVYEPPTDESIHKRSTQNPWLSWIRNALGTRSADVVHFLCHCYRIRGEGALALDESPVRNESAWTASLLFAAELTEFLNQIGAWSVAFTSPPDNGSSAGMRMLQDSVARLRPGPALLHDMKDPDSRRALAAAYRFLYKPPQPPPASPAISLYCHPFRAQGAATDEGSDRLLQKYTLLGRMSERLASTAMPAWLASSQRKLEASAGDLAAAEEVEPDNGRTRARNLVLNALADYAASPDSEGPEADAERSL